MEFSVNVTFFNKWRFLVGVLLLESSINFNIRRNTWRHCCKCHHDGKTPWLNLLSCLKAKEPHSSNRCSQTEIVTVFDIQSLLLTFRMFSKFVSVNSCLNPQEAVWTLSWIHKTKQNCSIVLIPSYLWGWILSFYFFSSEVAAVDVNGNTYFCTEVTNIFGNLITKLS